LNRTKSGFFVGNFTTRVMSDVNNKDYRASIDASEGMLRPTFTEDNVRLIYDSDNSTNVVQRGDNIYLNYTEEDYINQKWATRSTKINPYTATVYNGHMTLSPASDEWRDQNILARNVIDGGTKLSTKTAANWNNWEWNWGGKDIEDLKVGDQTNTITKTSGRTTTKTVNKVVKSSVVEERIGTRVVQVAMLPFIRSRIVSIRAQGLRPNSNVYLFMNGKLMTDYVREAAFIRYGKTTKDYGNTLRNKTAHPDGAGTLTTDNAGKVDISFMVPNNANHRFRAGTHEIKILDINANKDENSGTVARAIYTAKGWLDTIQHDVKSTRVLEVEGSKSSVTSPAPSYNRHSSSSNSGGSNSPQPAGGGGGYWTTSHYNAAGERVWKHSSGNRPLTTNPHNTTNTSIPGGGSSGNTDPAPKSDPTVLCSLLCRRGYLSHDIWEQDSKFGRLLNKEDPSVLNGYHAWAIPLVNWIEKDTFLSKMFFHSIAVPLTTAWAQHIAHRMEPKTYKDNKVGRFILNIGVPICRAIGKLVMNKKEAK